MTEISALLAVEAPVRTGCAHCSESHTGSLEAGRAWFQDHLERDHPDVRVTATPRKRGSSLHRIRRDA
jgi:hypothetical protein